VGARFEIRLLDDEDLVPGQGGAEPIERATPENVRPFEEPAGIFNIPFTRGRLERTSLVPRA
jgi:hypothetical protein